MTSSRAILAFVNVKAITRDSLPPGARINPTDPLMTAGCTNRCPRHIASNCLAHVEAPVSSRGVSAASALPPAMRAAPSVEQNLATSRAGLDRVTKLCMRFLERADRTVEILDIQHDAIPAAGRLLGTWG